MKKMSDLLTIKEAADLLGVSKVTLRNWDKSGKLQAYRHPINGYRMYSREHLDWWIKEVSTDVQNSK
jgi:excisionase family DNA binding protein